VSQPGTLHAKGFLHGRMGASASGWPTRAGTGPDGAFESSPETEFVMVMGSRRVAVDQIAARAGELVQVQQTVDLTDAETISFGYHLTQVPANADGLLWSVVVLVDGEERYRHRPAAGTEGFYTRRGIFVEDLAGDHDLTMRLQLEG